MNSYEENMRRSIVNTTKRFVQMTEDLKAKQHAADRAELDSMWYQAMHESIADGEDFTRYHFAALVAAAEREACAKLCEARFTGDLTREDMEAKRCAEAIRARIGSREDCRTAYKNEKDNTGGGRCRS